MLFPVVKLEYSEYGRPIIWLAESSTFGGTARNTCTFSNREEAVLWAKFEARGYIDWNVWKPERYGLRSDEIDDERFDPTFLAIWHVEKGGFVRVYRHEVSEIFNWAADNKWNSKRQIAIPTIPEISEEDRWFEPRIG